MSRTLQVGDRVRSSYRAPWQGSVVYGVELPAYVEGKGYD